MGITTIISS